RLIIVAFDALEWKFHGTGIPGVHGIKKTVPFGVGMQGQQGAQLAGSFLRLSLAIKLDRKVEMVVRVTGIGLRAPFEVSPGAPVPESRRGHAQVVVDLGKREARSQRAKRCCGAIHLSRVERRQAEIKLTLITARVARGNLAQPLNSGGIVPSGVVGLPQLQHRQRVAGIETYGFFEASNSFLVTRGQDAANIVLQRVYAYRRKLRNELLFAHTVRHVECVEHIPGESRL